MKLGYRLLLLLALFVGGLVYLTPTLVRPIPASWPRPWQRHRLLSAGV